MAYKQNNIKAGDRVYVTGKGKGRVTNADFYPMLIIETGPRGNKIKALADQCVKIVDTEPKEDTVEIEDYDHAVVAYMDAIIDNARERGYDVDPDDTAMIFQAFASVRTALWPNAKGKEVRDAGDER